MGVDPSTYRDLTEAKAIKKIISEFQKSGAKADRPSSVVENKCYVERAIFNFGSVMLSSPDYIVDDHSIKLNCSKIASISTLSFDSLLVLLGAAPAVVVGPAESAESVRYALTDFRIMPPMPEVFNASSAADTCDIARDSPPATLPPAPLIVLPCRAISELDAARVACATAISSFDDFARSKQPSCETTAVLRAAFALVPSPLLLTHLCFGSPLPPACLLTEPAPPRGGRCVLLAQVR